MTTDATPAAERAARYDLRPPARSLKYLEARALIEGASILPAAPWLLAQPRGDGRQIMVLPGFMFDDRSTWPLRRFLRYLGYESLPWHLGRNRGRPEHDAELLARRLPEVRRPDEPITLIGWSLGGVVARLVAQTRPEAVREVITLGTPVEGGPKYTAVGDRFARAQGIDLDEFEGHVHDINREGVTAPVTAIYSRSDGIVGWRAAIDRYNTHARHVRLPCSHLGMGVNPLVWRTIAQVLNGKSARPDG